jgi:hypothetical protein
LKRLREQMSSTVPDDPAMSYSYIYSCPAMPGTHHISL